MADASRVKVRYKEEVSFGVAPGGTYQEIRLVSESLEKSVDSTRSQELNSDRQTSDQVRIDVGAEGDINHELSYQQYDDFFKSAFQSAGFSSIVTSTEVTYAAVAAGNNFTDSGAAFVSDGFLVNQWVKVSGFLTNPTNNGFFKITVLAAGTMTVIGGTLIDEAAGDSVTILMGAQIVNGVALQTYHIEKEFTDLVNEFILLSGMALSGFNLEVNTQAIITGAFNFLGKDGTRETSSDAAGNTAAPTNAIMNAVDGVKSVLEGQTAFQKATSFSVTINNNLRQRNVLGVLGADSIGSGQFDVNGTLEIFFEDGTQVQKFMDFTASNLAIRIQDAAGNTYILDAPQLKYTNGNPNAEGINTDVIVPLDWEAFKHPVEGITFRLVRFVA